MINQIPMHGKHCLEFNTNHKRPFLINKNIIKDIDIYYQDQLIKIIISIKQNIDKNDNDRFKITLCSLKGIIACLSFRIIDSGSSAFISVR